MFYICCYKIVKIMETEKEKTKRLLEEEYSKGLTHGMWIGGLCIGAFIFLLMYLFPLP